MKGELVISFPTSDSQKETLKDFCKNKIGSDFIITVSQTLKNNYVLSLSIFENRPKVYIGIMDIERKKIISDARISDEDLGSALDNLEYKYAFATTRERPIANAELVIAWADYINSGEAGETIPIN